MILLDHVSKFGMHVALALANACTVANTSTTWQIKPVQAKCDFLTLGSGLHELYINLLEEGTIDTELKDIHL